MSKSYNKINGEKTHYMHRRGVYAKIDTKGTVYVCGQPLYKAVYSRPYDLTATLFDLQGQKIKGLVAHVVYENKTVRSIIAADNLLFADKQLLEVAPSHEGAFLQRTVNGYKHYIYQYNTFRLPYLKVKGFTPLYDNSKQYGLNFKSPKYVKGDYTDPVNLAKECLGDCIKSVQKVGRYFFIPRTAYHKYLDSLPSIFKCEYRREDGTIGVLFKLDKNSPWAKIFAEYNYKNFEKSETKVYLSKVRPKGWRTAPYKSFRDWEDCQKEKNKLNWTNPLGKYVQAEVNDYYHTYIDV